MRNLVSIIFIIINNIYLEANASSITKNKTGCVGFSVTLKPMVYSNGFNIACSGESSGMISVLTDGGNPPFSFMCGSTITPTPLIKDLQAGNYLIITTDASGCIDSSSISLNEPLALNPLIYNVNFNSGQGTCINASDGVVSVEVLGGTQPYRYYWSNGSTNDTLFNVPSGTYSLRIFDRNGCTYFSSFTATSSPPISITPTIQYCSSIYANDGGISLNISGGVQPYSLIWTPGGMTTSSISNLGDDAYSCTITDDNGCTLTQSFEVCNSGPEFILECFNVSTNIPISTGSNKGINIPLKVCADGSKGTIFKLTCADNSVNMTKYRYRVVNTGNPLIDGRFLMSYGGSSNLLLVDTFQHPLIMDLPQRKRESYVEIYNVDSPSVILFTYPIHIFKTPILFVHGLWGDKSSFNQLNQSLLDYFPIDNSYEHSSLFYNSDYKLSNDASLYYNRYVAQYDINKLLKKAHEAGYSAEKVDIIAHSMGGLLSRIYVQNIFGNTYRGDINKLIFLNTPNSGSQWANYLWNVPIGGRGLCEIITLAMTSGQSIQCDSAIENLRVSSDVLNLYLNDSTKLTSIQGIPCYSVATIGGMSSTFCTVLGLVTSLGAAQILLFNNEDNDLVVPLSSQFGGLSRSNMVINQCHMESYNNFDVKNTLRALINGVPDSSLFDLNGFTPPRLSSNFRVSENNKKYSNNNLDSIAIDLVTSSPIYPACELNVNITSTSTIDTLYIFATGSGYVYEQEVLTNGLYSLTLSVPINIVGSFMICAFGYNDNRELILDTVTFDVSSPMLLNSLNLIPNSIYLATDEMQTFNVSGCYFDGIVRDISSLSNINIYVTDTTVAEVISRTSIIGKSPGFTNLIVSYQNKYDTLYVEVYQGLNQILTSVISEDLHSGQNGCCKVRLSPNPTYGSFNIQLDSCLDNESISISIYNSIGQLEYRENNQIYRSENPLLVEKNLRSGLYIVCIRTKNLACSSRLIVQ